VISTITRWELPDTFGSDRTASPPRDHPRKECHRSVVHTLVGRRKFRVIERAKRVRCSTSRNRNRNSCVTSRRCHAAPSSSCGNTATSRPLRFRRRTMKRRSGTTPGSPPTVPQRRRRDRVWGVTPRHFAKSPRVSVNTRFASSSSSAWSATSRPSPAPRDIGERRRFQCRRQIPARR